MPLAVKEHVCRWCGRGFARREHVERHHRSHTKEQPFRCTVCPQRFTRRDLLTRHNRLNHGPAYPPVSSVGNIVTSTRDGEELTLPGTESTLAQPFGAVSQDDNLEMFNYIAWDDFGVFSDNLALPSHPFSPSYQPLPPLPADIFDIASPEQIFNEGRLGDEASSSAPTRNGTHLAALQAHEPEALSRYGSRLPSLEPEESPQVEASEISSGASYCPRLSPLTMDHARAQLASFSNIISSPSTLPSRHTFNRYIHGYIRGFHQHYPMFHLPTFTLDHLPVELLLAMASIGAQYCLERAAGFKLFHFAKAIALEQLQRQDRPADGPSHIIPNKPPTPINILHSVHSFILLTAVSMWSEAKLLSHEALSMRSILERLVRDISPKEYSRPETYGWSEWVIHESIQRAIIIAFCFFNLQTMLFDVPPMLLVQDVGAELPCSEREWEAETTEQWRRYRRHQPQAINFWHAFGKLFDGGEERPTAFSALGSHGLIHAVIQRIWLIHQTASLPSRSGALSDSDIEELERVLKRWRIGWEKDDEASATPLGGHGPMSFTSTALLRLAYIRLNMEHGPVPRSMGSWDPERIASNFAAMPEARRSTRVTRAALHCAHGLSIPVKLGIDFIARTQVFFWSNQYALCSLESALFLTKWLEAVTAPNSNDKLAAEEARLLDFVLQMVAETEYAADTSYLLATPRRLGAIVARLWAKLFREDSVWEIVGLIGSSLLAYAELLERKDRQA